MIPKILLLFMLFFATVLPAQTLPHTAQALSDIQARDHNAAKFSFAVFWGQSGRLQRPQRHRLQDRPRQGGGVWYRWRRLIWLQLLVQRIFTKMLQTQEGEFYAKRWSRKAVSRGL